MATLSNANLTLLDISKRLDPDGTAAAVAELLSQDNELLADMVWEEGNLPTGSRVTVRTGLPAATWRKLNKGVAETKSTTAQIDETCGIMEALGKVDVDLATLNGNSMAYRLSESRAFIEAMNQTMASALFYESADVNPERITGLAPRYGAISGAANGINVIDAGGTGSTNTSIWLVGWSPSTVTGIYPKGSQAGLVHEDIGLDWAFDANNNRYRAMLDRYQWKCGLALKDWRYVVRIANIDVTLLTKNASTGPDIIDLMTNALERIWSLQGVTPAFYCDRTIRNYLRRQTVNKVAAGTLAYDNVGGKPALMFAEVPCRRVDALLNTEARVV